MYQIKVSDLSILLTVSSLEAPAVNIRSKGGDIILNSIKIANSILGDSGN